jgi:alpha-ketoglutarate-dependent taurine dioxygenase
MLCQIQAPAPDMSLAAWAAANRAGLDEMLLEHRALLFRGFPVGSANEFQQFVRATSSGPLLEYKDRSTPRYEVQNGIYVSTIYPCEQRIHPHNEGTYWKTWPLKIAFCCLRAAARGGETPIADVRGVYERIDPDIRALFAARQVMYVRNYHPRLGLSWQETFQTQDPADVEAYGRQNDIGIEWSANGQLRTRQVRPAIRQRPVTGEPVWFNHAAFFHVTSLDPIVQEALIGSYGIEGLPLNTYFGDGSPIDAEIVAHLRAAYAAELQIFPWENGDVLLLDNMSMAHAREPYSGERQVIVAMTEAHS